jgi:hypothetical protein
MNGEAPRMPSAHAHAFAVPASHRIMRIGPGKQADAVTLGIRGEGTGLIRWESPSRRRTGFKWWLSMAA